MNAGPAVPAIVFGSGITCLGVIRALHRTGVRAFCVAPPHDLVTRSRWFRPLTGEIAESSEPASLAAVLEASPVDRAVLYACSDMWATAISALCRHAESPFVASIPDPTVLELFVDKAKFAETLDRLDVPHPRTIEIRDTGDLDSVGEEEIEGFFLKPRDSQLFNQRFGIKALRIQSKGEAAAHVEKASEQDVSFLLQEYIPGPATAHVFLDGFVDRSGRLCACFARRRIRMFPHEFGNSTLSVTIPIEEVGQAVADLRRLLERCNFRGMFDAEFKLDERGGGFKILEVNARPWWQIELAAACGVDVCGLAYRDALGLPVELVESYRIGRRWVYPAKDARAWWDSKRTDPRGTARPSPLSWLRSSHAVFSWRDPFPAMSELGGVLRKLSDKPAWRRSRRPDVRNGPGPARSSH